MPYAVGIVPHFRGDPLDPPVPFAEGVTFGRIEPWVLSEELADDLDLNLRGEFQESGWAFSWDGPEHVLSPEPDRVFKLANLAVWLARPSLFRVKLMVTFERQGRADGRRHASWGEHIFVHPEHEHASISRDDFTLAARLFKSFLDLDHGNTVATVAWVLWKALSEEQFIIRYMLCWVALESLYGPADGRFVKKRLSTRCGAFLGADSGRSSEITASVRADYDWRCKIVHGMRFQELTNEKQDSLSLNAETVLRDSLLRILQDPELVQGFNGPARESFLDGLD